MRRFQSNDQLIAEGELSGDHLEGRGEFHVGEGRQRRQIPTGLSESRAKIQSTVKVTDVVQQRHPLGFRRLAKEIVVDQRERSSHRFFHRQRRADVSDVGEIVQRRRKGIRTLNAHPDARRRRRTLAASFPKTVLDVGEERRTLVNAMEQQPDILNRQTE